MVVCPRDVIAKAPFAATGTYVSPVVTAGSDVLWGRAWVTAPAQDFVAAELDVRVGPSAVPDDSWSSWIRARALA